MNEDQHPQHAIGSTFKVYALSTEDDGIVRYVRHEPAIAVDIVKELNRRWPNKRYGIRDYVAVPLEQWEALQAGEVKA